MLVAAAEEERFCRIKHWAGFPAQAIDYCLRAAGADLGDVDHIAVNQNSRANLGGKLRYLLARRPSLDLIASRLSNRRDRAAIPHLIAQMPRAGTFNGEFHAVEHHAAHLSSAFHVSPFAEAAAVSVDGFGDFASAAWGVGRGSRIDIGGKVYFPHSLGLFYQAITQYPRLPALRRRIQSDGARALRKTDAARRDAQGRSPAGGREVRTRPCLFPPSHASAFFINGTARRR